MSVSGDRVKVFGLTVVYAKSVDSQVKPTFTLSEKITNGCGSHSQWYASTNAVEDTPGDDTAVAFSSSRSHLGGNRNDRENDVDNASTVNVGERYNEHREDTTEENENGSTIRRLLNCNVKFLGHYNESRIDQSGTHLGDESKSRYHKGDVDFAP